MVEFALVVPLFYLIVFGLVELGIVFAGYCGAEYATQVAVRYAISHGADSPYACSSASLATLVAPYLWAAQKNASTFSAVWSPSNAIGGTVTVTITLTYKTGIPLSSLNAVTLAASSQGTILY